jgi:hypothetical protein
LPSFPDLEDALAKTVRANFGEQVMLLFPTRIFGETLAASGALASAAAWEMLSKTGVGSILIISLGHQCGDLLLMSRSRGEPS